MFRAAFSFGNLVNKFHVDQEIQRGGRGRSSSTNGGQNNNNNNNNNNGRCNEEITMLVTHIIILVAYILGNLHIPGNKGLYDINSEEPYLGYAFVPQGIG